MALSATAYATRSESLHGRPSDNVLLQILDGFALRRNHPPHQVPDGHDPDHLLTLNDRKMTDPFARYDGQAFVHGMAGAHGKDLPRHDVFDSGVLGGSSLKNDFPGVIALGNNADHPL